MANTYTQIYIQVVFAVKGCQNLIKEQFRIELQKYITGIVSNRGQKLISIFCMPNHTHLLIGIKPNISISDLVRDIKAGSSGFINQKQWMLAKFNWQEGFGAFSYSQSQLNDVVQYIENQKEHHKKASFKEEYKLLLNKFKVDYQDAYLFDEDGN
ncbi:MAG: IS200/IS605 family transposase [Cyclobacteriaceae bacterium]|nr:IS200/IS605 family transposase [Cyclobacteriaceae bacterium]